MRPPATADVDVEDLDELVDQRVELDDEEDEEEDTGRSVGRAPMVVWTGGVDNPVRTVVDAEVVISGTYRLEGGLLLDVPPEPDTSPEPERLWRQRVDVPPADLPVHREPALELWHGTPDQPLSLHSYVEVRDVPRYRDPSAWRAALGPVAFSISRRASWHDPHTKRRAGTKPAPAELLGRWGPHDPVPATLGAAAPAVVLLSIAGGLVRLSDTGQTVNGDRVYGVTGDQLAALIPRLAQLDHAGTARARLTAAPAPAQLTKRSKP